MNVSFIGGAHFKKDDRNNYLAMLALINDLDFDPANFYFLNDNQFSKLAYRHCKNYKKLIPESKLIYIAAPSKKENIKENRYDLIVYPEDEAASPSLSVQEKYAIDHSDFVTIYDSNGLESNIASFYTLLSEKKHLDFKTYLNQGMFYVHTSVSITDELIRNYDKNITEPLEFVKNIFSYLHLHQEGMEKNIAYIITYQAVISYLFNRYFKHLQTSQYNAPKTKEAFFAAADIYCKKRIEEKKLLFDKNEIDRFSQYCQSQNTLNAQI